MDTQPEIRIAIVRNFLKSGESLRKASENLTISRQTLARWLKWYKEGGEENLCRRKSFRKSWNRPCKDDEEKVMLLKERNPSLTLKEAKKILDGKGTKMSLMGIWSIWRRYGLTGRGYGNPYAKFGPTTPETKDSLERIKKALKSGKPEEAAMIVNSLPSFPNDPIIAEIPEELLSPVKQLNRLYFAFGKIPFPEYYKRAKKIRKTLEKKELFYSSIFAGLMEFLALDWMVTPAKEQELLTMLRNRAKGIRDPSLMFLLSSFQCKLSAYTFNGKEARESFNECKRLLRYLPISSYFGELGNLSTILWNFRKASFYYHKEMDLLPIEGDRRIPCLKLSTTYLVNGKYRKSKKFLKDAKREIEGFSSAFAIIQAFSAFAQASFSDASSFFRKALEESKKGQLRNLLHSASLGLAETHQALGNEKKAQIMIQKYIPLFRKYRMNDKVLIRYLLLGSKVLVKEQTYGFPILRLFYHLQNKGKHGGYQNAIQVAKNNGLLGFFHRIIPFYPDLVLELLEKGKDTGLPRTILNFPIFNKEFPVYSVKFLGHLVVYKNQKYLKTSLRPKDSALLISLALSNKKNISLDRIYKNFWSSSKNPSRNLSHLLVRIRKGLKLPSHLFYIKQDCLWFDCYFTTDYGEYQEHIAQAKALLRAGEWGFAKREFIQAFKLFRGEPFRKMYDDWSDDKRLEALFSFETEVLAFAKELLNRGKKDEEHRLLKKARKIVPDSNEIEALLD
jgi:transposase/tetratricopeptide (TPR) repeat protein